METNTPKIGICGFNNIGNTCYMNSILQLLIHSKLIINFFVYKNNPYINGNTITDKLNYIDDLCDNDSDSDDDDNSDDNSDNDSQKQTNTAMFLKHLKKVSIYKIAEKENKLTISQEQLEKYIDNTITMKLAEIINIIIYRGCSTIRPTKFKQIIGNKIPELRGMAQQDSHEFLNGLFDNLIEETCYDSEPIINNVPESIHEYIQYLKELKKNIASETDKEKKLQIIENFNNYKKNNNDIIQNYNGLTYMINVFGKKRKSNYDTSSTGYNPMIYNLLTFNVDIYTCVQCNYEHRVYQYYTNLMIPVEHTLSKCFEKMIQEETINRRCDLCNCNQSTKKTKIWRPGNALFIELCRFTNSINGRTIKNNLPVEIPHQFDISPYCDDILGIKNNFNQNYIYKLKGISNHMGTMNGGHYTADCVSIVDNKTWYHFDDSNVSVHSNSNINTSNAYILLYEIE